MRQEMSAAALRQYSTDELLELFSTLEAPAISEMDGEYAARLLAQPGWMAARLGPVAINNPLGRWLCKAFRPVNTDNGRVAPPGSDLTFHISDPSVSGVFQDSCRV